MMQKILLIICLSNYICAYHSLIEWKFRDINQIKSGIPNDPSIILESNQTAICFTQSISLRITKKLDSIASMLYQTQIAIKSNENVITHDIFTLNNKSDLIVNDIMKQKHLIYCEFEDSICIPEVGDIRVDMETQVLSINFQNNTNQPDLSDGSNLLIALDIYPQPFGYISGYWRDPSNLDIFANPNYISDVVKAYKAGNFKLHIRNQTYSDSILTNFKFTGVGLFELFTIDSNTSVINSNKMQVHVESCDENIIPSSFSQTDERFYKFVDKIYHLKGIIPSGPMHSGIELSHRTLSNIVNESWSISFWIYLLNDTSSETDRFRTLFYKGDGTINRTPSVWLEPRNLHDGTDKLTIRVSSESDPDFGSTSINSLPHLEWKFLTFTFANITHEKYLDEIRSSIEVNSTYYESFTQKHGNIGDKSKYIASIYIDGKKDVSMQFTVNIIPNNGTLYLFNDPSFRGPLGYIRDVTIWNKALTNINIQDICNSGFATHESTSIQGSDPIKLLHLIQIDLEHIYHSFPDIYFQSNMTIIWSMPIDDVSFKISKDASLNCSSYDERLDIYAEAASLGNVESLYFWGMMKLFGIEAPNTICGIGALRKYYSQEEEIKDQLVGFFSLLYAIDLGYAIAITPISISLFSGLGIEILLQVDESEVDTIISQIPIPENLGYKKPPMLRFLQSLFRGDKEMLRLFQFTQDSLSTEKLSTNIAIALLHFAAHRNVNDAYMALAYRYRNGIDMLKDPETSLFYSIRASQAASKEYHKVGGQPIVESDRIDDSVEATLMIGNMGNDDELINIQVVRAKEGDIHAMLSVGDMHYHGARGLEKNLPLALDFFNRAAALNDPAGMCGAASMYIRGEGTEVNATKAIELYSKAMEMNSTRALTGLGYIYHHGLGNITKNDTKAFEYFLQAAEKKQDSDSLFNTAFCYERGVGVERNLSKAIHYYSLAAHDFGHFDAVFNLGIIYNMGYEVSRNVDDALRFFTATSQIGAWIQWVRRGFDHFLHHSYLHSLWSYSYVAELGYEVGQSNAAFVLRKKISKVKYFTEKLSNVNETMICNSSDSFHLSQLNNDRFSSLQLRYLLLAASNGNKKSYLQIGNYYLTLYFQSPDHYNYNQALLWYKKASYSNMSMASLYLGMMYHLSINSGYKYSTENNQRAIRYYNKAVRNYNSTDLSLIVLYVIKFLLFVAKCESKFPFLGVLTNYFRFYFQWIYVSI